MNSRLSQEQSASAGHQPADLPRVANKRQSRPRALVTGGAGFIGSNVAADLVQRGYEVIIYDSLVRPGVEENLRWLQSHYGEYLRVETEDIRNATALKQAIAHADMVFHFAAQVAVTTSLVNPIDDFDVNVRGTLNVLEACRARSRPPSLLFTSTNKVYGDLTDLKLERSGVRYQPQLASVASYGISESRPLDFRSPYGCSKGAADQYVLDYARCYRIPAAVFRMSCIYGPRQCGNEDQGWVAHFVRATLRGEEIVFYGDGCQVRDLLYIDDLLRAMRLTMANMDRAAGRAFNIGGGPANALSLRDLVAHLGRLHGAPPEVRTAPWREGDQRYYVSDTRRFQRLLGWAPQVAPAAGLTELFQWLREHHRSVAAAS